MTDTTPLDLDEAIETFIAAWNAKRIEIGRGIAPAGTKTRAGLEAVGYPALLDRIRELEAECMRFEHIHIDDCVSSDQMTRTIEAMQVLRADLDAAVARAEAAEAKVAAGLAAIDDDGQDPERPVHPERIDGWRACANDVRTALAGTDS